MCVCVFSLLLHRMEREFFFLSRQILTTRFRFPQKHRRCVYTKSNLPRIDEMLFTRIKDCLSQHNMKCFNPLECTIINNHRHHVCRISRKNAPSTKWKINTCQTWCMWAWGKHLMYNRICCYGRPLVTRYELCEYFTFHFGIRIMNSNITRWRMFMNISNSIEWIQRMQFIWLQFPSAAASHDEQLKF